MCSDAPDELGSLTMTDVGVRLQKKNPKTFAATTRAASSGDAACGMATHTLDFRLHCIIYIFYGMM